jgi:hypothetical protein
MSETEADGAQEVEEAERDPIADLLAYRPKTWHGKPELVALLRAQAELLRGMADYCDSWADRGEKALAKGASPGRERLRLIANRVAGAVEKGCFDRSVGWLKQQQRGAK